MAKDYRAYLVDRYGLDTSYNDGAGSLYLEFVGASRHKTVSALRYLGRSHGKIKIKTVIIRIVKQGSKFLFTSVCTG